MNQISLMGKLLVCMIAITLALEAPVAAEEFAADTRRLDQHRAELYSPSGATVHGFDQKRIQSQPGGENRPLNSTLLQAPGVSVGSNGGVHVRGQ